MLIPLLRRRGIALVVLRLRISRLGTSILLALIVLLWRRSAILMLLAVRRLWLLLGVWRLGRALVVVILRWRPVMRILLVGLVIVAIIALRRALILAAVAVLLLAVSPRRVVSLRRARLTVLIGWRVAVAARWVFGHVVGLWL